MSFAVVELKYMPKKTFIVPISWIKNYIPNHLSTVEFYCYISTDLKDDPNFQAKYYVKFTGTAGLFKVFILKVTDSLIDAVSYQEQKRNKSIPQKFRQPGNTDIELNAENTKRKKKEKIVKKKAQQSAKVKNMAHLALALGKSATTNIVDHSFIPAITNHNVQVKDSTDFSPNNDLETGIQNQSIVFPIVSNTTNTPPADVQVYETEIPKQSIFVSIDSAPTEILLNDDAQALESEILSQPVTFTDDSATVNDDAAVLETEIQNRPVILSNELSSAVLESEILSQPVTFTDDSPTVDVPPNDAAVFENGVQNRPGVLSYELSSAVTNNYSDIVLLAMEGLEGVDFSFIGDLNFTEGVDMNLTEGRRSDADVASTSESGQNFTKTIVIDVPLNGSDSVNVLNSATGNSLSTPLNLPKQQNCGKENTPPLKIHQNLSVGEIDYKKAYLQLKEQNSSLGDRNLALQNALVAADKALGKVPLIPFTKKDGGRLYAEGVFFNADQCKALDATRDDNKYVNNLVVSVFGRDTLKISSVTGTQSKNHKGPAKPGLNPLWLQLVYDLTDAKTNKRLTKAETNKIINKKISNLNGAENRKLLKQKRCDAAVTTKE